MTFTFDPSTIENVGIVLGILIAATIGSYKAYNNGRQGKGSADKVSKPADAIVVATDQAGQATLKAVEVHLADIAESLKGIFKILLKRARHDEIEELADFKAHQRMDAKLGQMLQDLLNAKA